MSPVVCDHPVDDENAAVIHGRPDFAHGAGYGVTEATKHPPYVFGVRSGSCLVHKVLRVECHWLRVSNSGHDLIRLKRPVMIAITNCQYHFRLTVNTSRTCQVPKPDALLCGRCHGEGATFGKRGPARNSGLTRQEAGVKLGCVVNGY